MFHHPMLWYSRQTPALNTLIFSKGKVGAHVSPMKGKRRSPTEASIARVHPCGRHGNTHPGSTTGVLTAATFIYAIGAGITAAAGTRLALQLFLVKMFTLCSFQLQVHSRTCIVISCHYLPVSGLGDLCDCCLPL